MSIPKSKQHALRPTDAEYQRRIEALLATIATLESKASQPVKRATVKPKVNPYKANRLARRALAASMRKAGQPITPASWAAAKKTAGIVPVKARKA